ncbi:MAG TPA: class I SAM-dependent methyltransferase [Candidatus Omnitrophota bacterium]|nr:class I SAM-dependent methyltransferase [Candidatus Omnitrophota bacterium]
MNKTSERYTLSNNRDEIYWEHMQRYLFAKEFLQNKNVLDVACGSGYGSQLLAKNSAASVVGVDLSEEAIDYCKKNYRSENLSFQVMDAARLKFSEAAFHTIVSFETIEHITNPDSMLAEMKRVLCPQGTIMISTPNNKVYGLLKGDAHQFHVKEYCLDEFQALVGRHFCIQKMYGQRRSDHYEEKIGAYPRAIKDATKNNIFLRENPYKIKNLIPNSIRQYLSKKIMNLPFPKVASLEDLVISENNIEESKFFICVATK